MSACAKLESRLTSGCLLQIDVVVVVVVVVVDASIATTSF